MSLNGILKDLPHRKFMWALSVNLASWPVLTAIVANLLFLFNIYTPLLCLGLTLAGSAAAGWFSVRCAKSASFAFAGMLGILLVCCLLAGFIIDSSYDGQQYHAEAILQLANGFNPLREMITPDIWDISWAVWLNALPKTPWLIEVQAYAVFGNIDSAKILSLYVMAATLITSLTLIGALNIGSRITWFCSVLAALNPVIISQSISAYTDGYAGAWIMMAALALVVLYQRRAEGPTIFLFLAFLANAVLAKFSQVVPAGILGVIFWLLMWRRSDWPQSFRWPAVLCFVILLGGINPYISNIVRYGNLGYPMVATNYLKPLGLGQENRLGVGEGFADFIYQQHEPVNFHEVPEPLQGFASIFAKSAHANIKYPAEFKVYPTISLEELGYLANPDGRVGGFGPLFGFITVLSMLLLLVLSLQQREDQMHGIAKASITIGVAILIAFLMTPFNWWARYVAYLWIVPILALIAGSDYHFSRWKKYVVNILLLACLVNCIGIGVAVILKGVRDTHKMKKAYAAATVDNPYPLLFSTGAKRVDLAKAGVPFISPEIEGRFFVEHIAPNLTPEEAKLFDSCYVLSPELGTNPPFSWQTYTGQSMSMFNNLGMMKLKDNCDKPALVKATARVVQIPFKTESLW